MNREIKCKKCGVVMQDQEEAKKWDDIGSLIVCEKCVIENPDWVVENM